jgi:hypothetical protein
VQDQKGTLGKLLYDPSVHDEAKQFLANGNDLVSDVRSGRGTLGKLATDDTLFTYWKQIGENLQQTTSKLNTDNGDGRQILQRSEVLRQPHGTHRRHAIANWRLPQGPQEVPAREVLHLLAPITRIAPSLPSRRAASGG